ncbi:hypothetical protein [Phytoactinopolyspora mesophila]|uniref:DUF4439 domain-containing protein n=1 Tax=Phytoactinopolyspora mesophila TaxID=2650750 RepID=A0A7K3MA70_9ACTN|nr:hypothetical protein [Phytoactinopolyspora mesophila]NDL59288.1 hypothetical protein [Phytoactinopolyspora mesophila]
MNDRPAVDAQRRRLLLALVGTPALGMSLAACTQGPSSKHAPPGVAPDADTRVRWRAVRAEQELLIRHAATLDQHAELSDHLAPLTSHHWQHLAALLDEGPLPRLATLSVELPSGAESGGDASAIDLDLVDAPEIPDDADAALEALREAERDAAEAQTAESLRAAAPRLATLLASIAAAEAVHHASLEDT